MRNDDPMSESPDSTDSKTWADYEDTSSLAGNECAHCGVPRSYHARGAGHQFAAIGATDESFPLFRCPGCKHVGDIDDDQFHGRVSIDCTNCDYHETQDWSAQEGE